MANQTATASSILTVKLDTFTRAYLEAALWLGMQFGESEYDECESVDLRGEYDWSDLTPQTRAAILGDCEAFQAECSELIGLEADRAGADFLLTRNGHGTGFWDRPDVYGTEAARRLSAAARVYGGFTLVLSPDGSTIDHCNG